MLLLYYIILLIPEPFTTFCVMWSYDYIVTGVTLPSCIILHYTFFNQQFIIWSMRANYSSHFITTINGTKRERKSKTKRKQKRKQKLYSKTEKP